MRCGGSCACGAPLTLAVVAAPWFIYVGAQAGFESFYRELRNNYEGGDHNRPLLQYIPGLLVAAAPWTALFPLAIVDAARGWRSDGRMRALLLWLLSIAVPLCVAGNRQNHYLLPLMPPLMILVGWLIDRAITGAAAPIAKLTIVGTLIVVALAPIAVIASGAVISTVQPLDIAFACALAAGVTMVAIIWRVGGLGRGVAAFIIVVAIALPLLITLWLPRLQPDNPRAWRSRSSTRSDTGRTRFME